MALVMACGGMILQTVKAEYPLQDRLIASLVVGAVGGLAIQQTGKIYANQCGLAVGGAATYISYDYIAHSALGKNISPLMTLAAALSVGGVSGYATANVLEKTAAIEGFVGGAALAAATFRMLS